MRISWLLYSVTVVLVTCVDAYIQLCRCDCGLNYTVVPLLYEGQELSCSNCTRKFCVDNADLNCNAESTITTSCFRMWTYSQVKQNHPLTFRKRVSEGSDIYLFVYYHNLWIASICSGGFRKNTQCKHFPLIYQPFLCFEPSSLNANPQAPPGFSLLECFARFVMRCCY